ncbi:hypothetical protein BT63DRAFT_56870 [Microthyrium microscopicum]|uniref:C2H2-type domain-containing protein n=1 Tax=Microthyrium microscopicum TaxID=703497 RepID=A0A6A6U355_9PEZI|nr:hypothetical protein BT63DRAFT_56870 [Microthyrium microscopicum]
MAAMVAPQQSQALWDPSRRSGPVMHMNSMPMNSMVPASSAPSSRSYHTSHVELQMPMFQPTSGPVSMPFQAGAYGFDITAMNQYPVQQTYNMNYQHPVPPPASYPPNSNDISAPVPLVRDARNALPSISREIPVKSEVHSPTHYNDHSTETIKSSSPDDDGPSIVFTTDVDCLMRAIQAKSNPAPQQGQAPSAPEPKPEVIAPPPPPPQQHQAPPQHHEPRTKSRKKYFCSIDGCNKSFFQKTHLEIHTRAHTGVKPFVCKEPSCGQRFSQLGNLKTHERRHTGERPYQCDICGKTFAQRGNVRAHKIVHQQIKPFTCRLDDCGKQFTQLGNLKSHQNKFHQNSLRYLTSKFANYREGDPVTAQDKELWEYFALLYKNSNKGIKGRGKDRRISTVPSSACSTTSFTSTASYPGVAAPAMSRAATNGSMHGHMSDRDSRASSYGSAHTHMEPQHQPVRPVHQIPQGYPQHYEEQHYNNMVFPERKYV